LGDKAAFSGQVVKRVETYDAVSRNASSAATRIITDFMTGSNASFAASAASTNSIPKDIALDGSGDVPHR